eukprot:TRINITY_DN8186_c0_g1_i1.p1 TRINITY_DN8186_c0_g1~~TRINITY_DN8186_c0_g1_i1.p1  ORF type:complete len:362 (+),score=48.34 TRINITY_DN8186_c0_g1_i1:34-1086(+)
MGLKNCLKKMHPSKDLRVSLVVEQIPENQGADSCGPQLSYHNQLLGLGGKKSLSFPESEMKLPPRCVSSFSDKSMPDNNSPWIRRPIPIIRKLIENHTIKFHIPKYCSVYPSVFGPENSSSRRYFMNKDKNPLFETKMAFSLPDTRRTWEERSAPSALYSSQFPPWPKYPEQISQAGYFPNPPGWGSGIARDDKKKEDSSSLSLDSNKDTKMIKGSAYKKRNVYKSVIRHVYSYMRKNRDEVFAILQRNHYSLQEIEHAFYKINFYNDMERQKGNPKKSQAIIKKIVEKKSIYTYLLRETLNAMMKNWEQGKLGKVSKSNCEIYREVSQKYYLETVRLTGQEAEGRSYSL